MERLLAALAVLLVHAATANAAELKFPSLAGRIVDGAGLLSETQVQRIGSYLAAHEDRTTNQVVVVTLASLQDVTIEEFGYRLGRHWGIGRKERNNGVLLVVAPRERKVRIEVGYGLEGVLTDALSKTIIETAIVPRFKAGDMAGGIVAGAMAIVAVLEGRPVASPEQPKRGAVKAQPSKTVVDTIFLLIVLFVVAMSGLGWRQRGRGRGAGYGGGGYSGGGFSGGGGGFGGGGASGGW